MDSNVLNTLVSAVIPPLATILVGAVVIVAKNGVALLKTKLGNEKYNSVKNYALDAFNVTEEIFKKNPSLKTNADSKLKYFGNVLRNLVPEITDDEIKLFSKSIAGEFNKNKQAIASTIFDSPIIASTTIDTGAASSGLDTGSSTTLIGNTKSTSSINGAINTSSGIASDDPTATVATDTNASNTTAVANSNGLTQDELAALTNIVQKLAGSTSSTTA